METETPVQIKILPRGEMLKARLASSEAVSKMSEEEFDEMFHKQMTSFGYILDPTDPEKKKYIHTPEDREKLEERKKANDELRRKEFAERRLREFAERKKQDEERGEALKQAGAERQYNSENQQI